MLESCMNSRETGCKRTLMGLGDVARCVRVKNFMKLTIKLSFFLAYSRIFDYLCSKKLLTL